MPPLGPWAVLVYFLAIPVVFIYESISRLIWRVEQPHNRLTLHRQHSVAVYEALTLKQKRLISLVVFLGSLGLVILGNVVFDVVIAYYWGKEATISVAMRHINPIWVYAFGYMSAIPVMLAFHFWFNPAVHGTEDDI